jgi:hypothetical protein
MRVQHDCSNIGGLGAVAANSGLTVANSVPGVIQPTTLARAGQTPDARRPISAVGGDHDKSWSGFGDEVPNKETNSEAVRNPPFLDELKINRNMFAGRGRHCGRFSVRGYDPKTGLTTFYRVNCKCWDCRYCGPRKAKRYKRAIVRIAEALRLCRFVTLTLDPSKIEGDPVRYLNRVWAKLRVYLKRKYGVAPAYIRVLEFQQSGNPHFHLLIDRFIVQSWLQEAWQAVGGGRFVRLQWVDIHRVARYVSKYLTKELLLSAPLRSRRVTTSRGLHLSETPPKEIEWEFLQVPIFVLFHCYKAALAAFRLDSEGILEGFSICG